MFNDQLIEVGNQSAGIVARAAVNAIICHVLEHLFDKSAFIVHIARPCGDSGHHTAELGGVFNYDDLQTETGGANRRRDSGSTAAADDDIGFVSHGNIACRFKNSSVHNSTFQ